MSLGNALPTETTTAAVDSCSILQTETNEKGKSGQRVAFYAENKRFRNVTGDSSLVNQTEIQHAIQMTFQSDNLIPILQDPA